MDMFLSLVFRNFSGVFSDSGVASIVISLIIIFTTMLAMLVIIGAGLILFCTTEVQQGKIVAIVTGGKLVRWLSNLEGHEVDQSTGKILPVDKIDPKNRLKFTRLEKLLLKDLGRYWVGIPPFRKVYSFDVIKERIKADTSGIRKMADMIENEGKVTVYELYWRIPRPFLLREVDFKGGYLVDILMYGIFRVLDPQKLLFELDGDFFQPLAATVKKAVLEEFGGMEWDTFLATQNFNVDKLNSSLETLLGLQCEVLGREDFAISESAEAMQSAIQEEEIAKRKAKAKRASAEGDRDAKIIQAEGEKKSRILQGEGDAGAIEVIAVAKAKRYEELINLFSSAGMDMAEATVKATEQISLEFRADAIGKIQGTFVEGGAGAGVNINTGRK